MGKERQPKSGRRDFLKIVGKTGISVAAGGILSGCAFKETPISKVIETLFPEDPKKAPKITREKVAQFTQTITKEIRQIAEATKEEKTPSTPTASFTKKTPEVTPISGTEPRQTQTPTLSPTEEVPQETPIPKETPEKSRYEIGWINFADMEIPLKIVYPTHFEGKRTKVLENLKILVSEIPNTEDENYLIFIRPTLYGKGKLIVYPEVPSETFVLGAHVGYIKDTNIAMELEPFRRMIEGPIANRHGIIAPYEEKTVLANLEKTIGLEFTFVQGDKEAKFKIIKAARMNAEKAREYNLKGSKISEIFDSFEIPDNSFILLTCSRRQPNEAPEPQNELFPGRFVFVLQYSPEKI